MLSGPAVRRLRLAGLVFDALGLSLTRIDAVSLIEKLDVIELDRLQAGKAGDLDEDDEDAPSELFGEPVKRKQE